MSVSCPKTNLSADVVKLPKGTVVKLNGFPCELAQETEVLSAAISGMGLEAFLRWSGDEQQGKVSSRVLDESREHHS
jgi:hypothetical protein